MTRKLRSYGRFNYLDIETNEIIDEYGHVVGHLYPDGKAIMNKKEH